MVAGIYGLEDYCSISLTWGFSTPIKLLSLVGAQNTASVWIWDRRGKLHGQAGTVTLGDHAHTITATGQHHPLASPVSPPRDFPPRKQSQKTTQTKRNLKSSGRPGLGKKKTTLCWDCSHQSLTWTLQCKMLVWAWVYTIASLVTALWETKLTVCCYRTGNVPISVLNAPIACLEPVLALVWLYGKPAQCPKMTEKQTRKKKD